MDEEGKKLIWAKEVKSDEKNVVQCGRYTINLKLSYTNNFYFIFSKILAGIESEIEYTALQRFGNFVFVDVTLYKVFGRLVQNYLRN